jgi:SAM-dependent methyltransferase
MGVKEGYDAWADEYDATANYVVALDDRVTPPLLATQRGGLVLDAGCGTGRHFARLLAAGCRVVGIDFSAGMLRVARRKHPDVPLVIGDLQRGLPLGSAGFDAVLCALVGEHLDSLSAVFREFRRVLVPGGRLLCPTFHPILAEAGKEARFERDGVDHRLGAIRHTAQDYEDALDVAGFEIGSVREYRGDQELARAIPRAEGYIGFPMLLVYDARVR